MKWIKAHYTILVLPQPHFTMQQFVTSALVNMHLSYVNICGCYRKYSQTLSSTKLTTYSWYYLPCSCSSFLGTLWIY